ncbi:MAG: tRNA uridine-5-carboxymethylaminomethyl(34) synthesis GTPase MnmE [Gammaproteobacteria bacterium]
MAALEQDTIAAIASPPGRGGIGIVRISGPLARTIADSTVHRPLRPRFATYTRFVGKGGETLDQGIALLYEAPHSYTGEDVLELHAHGSPVALDLLLQNVLNLGARMARPGEFSQRAFLSGKLDLTQAEAIADLINSATAEAARAALHSLKGEFSTRVRGIFEQLIAVRTRLEGTLDFPEEDIDPLDRAYLGEQLVGAVRATATLIAQTALGQMLTDGVRVVIAGPPNVGKSSLLNRFAREDCAIVTPVAGTTRDAIHVEISLGGLLFHFTDTAGLRATSDPVESEGIRRTHSAVAQADHVLFVLDASDRRVRDRGDEIEGLPACARLTWVYNKIDLIGAEAAACSGPGGDEVYLSAKTGAGMALLEQHLKTCVGYNEAPAGAFSARRRHVDALRRVQASVQEAQKAFLVASAPELVAEHLRLAQQALSEITGDFTSEDLLSEIFSTFCVGK